MEEEKQLVVKASELNLSTVDSPDKIGGPVGMLVQMQQAGVPIESIDKLIDAQERYQAIEAKKAYVEAMTRFSSNVPEIRQDKHVHYTKKDGSVVEYWHESLKELTTKVMPVMSAYGLSHSYKSRQENGVIIIKCIITHEKGHKEETELQSPADSSGGKNGIQAIGSTVKYLKRYTLKLLLGIEPEEYDDDGVNSVEPQQEYISVEKQNEIRDILASRNEKESGLLKWLKVESIDQVTESQYKQAISMLGDTK